jgi:hypothetical protein
MARRKKTAKTKVPAAGDGPTDLAPFGAINTQETQVFTGNLPLHELFQQQARQVLEQSDLDDEAKQAILVAMSCPCCGAGGMNYTAKVNRRR